MKQNKNSKQIRAILNAISTTFHDYTKQIDIVH